MERGARRRAARARERCRRRSSSAANQLKNPAAIKDQRAHQRAGLRAEATTCAGAVFCSEPIRASISCIMMSSFSAFSLFDCFLSFFILISCSVESDAEIQQLQGVLFHSSPFRDEPSTSFSAATDLTRTLSLDVRDRTTRRPHGGSACIRGLCASDDKRDYRSSMQTTSSEPRCVNQILAVRGGATRQMAAPRVQRGETAPLSLYGSRTGRRQMGMGSLAAYTRKMRRTFDRDAT